MRDFGGATLISAAYLHLFVTTNRFTRQALDTVRRSDIVCVDRNALEMWRDTLRPPELS
jgi:hypothetical protein